MSALHDELIKILEDETLTPYFQPVVSIVHKKIIGYEALIRGPSDSPLYTPFVLFTTADQINLSNKLEYLSREISLKHYAGLDIPEKLFINVSPAVLLHPDFKQTIASHFQSQLGLTPSSVVIEITEHQVTDNYLHMRDMVKHCRDMGFQIALDDLGSGYSGLRLWTEIQPDYVKIDKHFIADLHQDEVKLNFVRSIQTVASSIGCQVIAEGVETEEEFKAVKKLGICYAQGFYFAKPTATPLRELDIGLLHTGEAWYMRARPLPTVTAAHIAKKTRPLPSATPITEVLEWFQTYKDLSFLPLVDDNRPTGIIQRDHFFATLFSSRYGLEL
ncbi:MAG: EAL domain-containing protein [Methylovulum sp.]|nr:EAL domain-containing protein [Methylovulum sp.]